MFIDFFRPMDIITAEAPMALSLMLARLVIHLVNRFAR